MYYRQNIKLLYISLYISRQIYVFKYFLINAVLNSRNRFQNSIFECIILPSNNKTISIY